MSRRSIVLILAGTMLAIPATASAGVLKGLDGDGPSPGAAVSDVAHSAPRGHEARELGSNHGEAVREAAHDRSRLPEQAQDPGHEEGDDGERGGHGRPADAGRPDHAGGNGRR